MPANLSHALPPLKSSSSSTRYFAFFGLAIAMPSYATGQLFRCDSLTGPVYQTDTCTQARQTIDRARFPAAEEEKRPQPISNGERVRVAQVESEGEKLRRDATTGGERDQREKDAQQARCENHLADANRSEQTATPKEHHRDRVRANDEARALRSQHFAECLGR